MLKREPSAIFKTKSNPSVYTLASQLLLVALGDSYDWPESVAKVTDLVARGDFYLSLRTVLYCTLHQVYIEDSLGDRLWVDLESCRKLVDNICTIFQTRPYSPGSSSGSSSGSGSSSTGVHTQVPKTGQAGETSSTSGPGGKREGDGVSGTGGEAEQSGELPLDDVEIAPRFSPSSIKSLKVYILQLVGEQMGRHGDISRNFLRFLTTAAGLPDIRLKVAQKIEGWIQNPKVGSSLPPSLSLPHPLFLSPSLLPSLHPFLHPFLHSIPSFLLPSHPPSLPLSLFPLILLTLSLPLSFPPSSSFLILPILSSSLLSSSLLSPPSPPSLSSHCSWVNSARTF